MRFSRSMMTGTSPTTVSSTCAASLETPPAMNGLSAFVSRVDGVRG